jgi:murein DD-endopeptidase MepM/ murein hydrolase activator NlpD
MHRHRRRVIAVIVTCVILLALFVVSLVYFPTEQLNEEPSFTNPPEIPIGSQSSEIAAPITPLETTVTPAQPEVPTQKQHITVKHGDSLSTIFDQQHISPQQLYEVAKLPLVKDAVKKLHAGQVLDFSVDDKGQLQYFSMPVNHTENIVVTRTSEGFVANKETQAVNIATTLKQATISSSFFQAGANADIPQIILTKLVKIYAWKIDFKTAVRKGDHFKVLYQLVKNVKTQKVEPGNIIAAVYTHNSTNLYAFRYRDRYGRSDYYDETGKSLRKAFMRRPINIGRISSPFSLRRMDPVLKKVRPHTGTDFAAPYGTPIHATGDGRIILQGRKGGYGRCIVINHGNNITTLYGHMSRYNNKFKVGSYVKMGDVIGYIGTSGWSTGPHVHYEYRIKHKYENPMTVNLPNAAPISAKERSSYKNFVAEQIKKLATVDTTAKRPTN